VDVVQSCLDLWGYKMNWENVLKRGAATKINYPVFKRAIEHVISDLDEFTFEDIKNQIVSVYAHLLVTGNHMSPNNATQHAKGKIDINTVGRIISRMGTHKASYTRSGAGRITVYKKVEEEE
jgi:hypothetical protein